MKSMFFKVFLTTAAVCGFTVAFGQQSKMQPFKLNQVKLLQSPFLSAEQTDLNYMLKLDPDRLLAPFLREAGLKPKAQSYGNWESTGLDGHTAGHYLTALAQMYASDGSLECKKRIDYMVAELGQCQENSKIGYIGGVPGGIKMWAQFKTGDFSEFNRKWVPWYNLHKLFAGLRDCFLLANSEQARQEFLKLADWTYDETNGLSDKQMQSMLNMEHGGMDEVLADAYALTGDRKYLILAERFCHKQILDPLERHVDNLTGLHANTQIPKVVGFQRIAELTNDSNYSSAARFFWQTVVRNRSISIGGNSVREHFNPADNFESMIESEQGPETCNSNNILKLSKMLFLDEGKPEYIDFYERLLYNHILSSQHPVTGGFVYFTPIHPQHYRVYSTADESFWCCVGTGMENHGKYGELIYSHKNNNVYVNLFIPSVLQWKQNGIKLTQQNKFPDEEQTALSVDVSAPKRFTIFIRKPQWVKDGGFAIKVNGKNEANINYFGAYAGIKRIWHKGDKITVMLPMKNYAEYLPDHSAWVSFLHGPFVLAAPTDTSNLNGLFANDSRWGHIAGGKLYTLTKSPLLVKTDVDPVNALKEEGSGKMTFEISDMIAQPQFKNLKLIPFYRVHDTRYMLYWPITTKDSVKQKEAEFATLDEIYLKLAPRTFDEVTPGEQQPEADHAMTVENSETGIFRSRHWRSAKGNFSYRMRSMPAVKSLGITYYGKDINQGFDIYVNDTKLTHVKLDGSGPDTFVTDEYLLPDAVKANSRSLIVKFVATDGSSTARVYDVRVLR
ncbi:MAG: beta-L-arabinofuranosidase domain-containing protein [Mucilaginibacter sp.]